MLRRRSVLLLRELIVAVCLMCLPCSKSCCPSGSSLCSLSQYGMYKMHHSAYSHEDSRRTCEAGRMMNLRGGEAEKLSAPLVTRTGSVIEKEMQAKALKAMPQAPSQVLELAGELPDEKPATTPTTGSKRVITQRVTKLNSIYHVNFDESGVLGTGTFSTVRVAVHKVSGLKYAVKATSLVDINPPALVRLRREIQVLRSLSHPNIIGLYEIFEENNFLYMIMEMCTGGELWHFLQKVDIHPNGDKFYHTSKGRVVLTELKVASIIRQIVDAVGYCHERNIAHRDLKLENLMFTHDGDDATIKLIDFGFSKVFSGNESMHAVLGSPYYVAPEILFARGHGTRGSTAKGYGPLVDVWSIGVISYMILCGQAPFDGSTDTERLNAVKRGMFMYPPKAGLSSSAMSFINGCLQMNPDKRMTIKEILAHPWMRGTTGSKKRCPVKWITAI